MTISKEQFCKIINDLKENDEFVNTLNDVFIKYNLDMSICSTKLEDTVVNFLEAVFEDKGEWISYWCWELNFGETYEEGDIKYADGTIIPLKTTEDLYDFLIKNLNEE